MSRYQKLKPDEILKAAEAVIREDGAHALSIRNVAAKCGVSKGGVQSNFGTIDHLISSLFRNWGEQLDKKIKQVRAEEGDEISDLQLFLKASRQYHMSHPEHNAALMILMTQSEDRREYARNWLDERMKKINTASEDGKKLRLYFLINEALLAVKSVQIVGLKEEEWLSVFDELDELFGY